MTKAVAHRQRYGKTTEWHGTGVYVSRQAVLTEELDRLVGLHANAIVLVFGDGYADAEERSLDPKHALELYHALGNALMAVKATEESALIEETP